MDSDKGGHMLRHIKQMIIVCGLMSCGQKNPGYVVNPVSLSESENQIIMFGLRLGATSWSGQIHIVKQDDDRILFVPKDEEGKRKYNYDACDILVDGEKNIWKITAIKNYINEATATASFNFLNKSIEELTGVPSDVKTKNLVCATCVQAGVFRLKGGMVYIIISLYDDNSRNWLSISCIDMNHQFK